MRAVARAGRHLLPFCLRCSLRHDLGRCQLDPERVRTETTPPKRARRPLKRLYPVRVTDCRDPWYPRRKRTAMDVAWEPDLRLRDVVAPDRLEDLDDWVVSVNGARLEPAKALDHALAPGDGVLVCTRPRDPFTIAFTVVMAIASLLVSADAARRAKVQAHHAARRAAAQSQLMQDSLVYGWDGVRNSITPGRAIPVLYGEHRIGGHYVYAENRPAKTRDVLDCQLIVSEGEVDGPVTSIQAGGDGTAKGTVQINDAPIGDYPGVVFGHRVGTTTQLAVQGIWPTMLVRTKTNPGSVLDPTGATPTTFISDPNRTGFELHIGFPDGFRLRDSATGTILTSGFRLAAIRFKFDFSVRFRSWPSGSFGTPSTYSSGFLFATTSLSASARQPDFVIKTPSFTADRFEIEITLTGITVSRPNWLAATWGWANHTFTLGARVTLREVREFNEVVQAHPGRAFMALSVPATDKLGGSLPTITALWRGLLCRIYSSVPGDTIVSSTNGATGSSNNVFTDTGQTFLATGVLPGDKIVITTGADAGTYFVRTVSGGTSLLLGNPDGTTPSFNATSGNTYTIATKRGVYTTEFTQNPAWCALDVLANAVHGGGAWLDYDVMVDLQSFKDAAVFCDALISRGLDSSDPITSGSGTGIVPSTPADRFIVTGLNFFNAGVRIDDTLVIETGVDAGSYRIDSVDLDSQTTGHLNVSNTDGTPANLTASQSGLDWRIENTHRRCQCDHYFDSTGNVWEHAGAIARNARLGLVRVGGRPTLIPDEDPASISAVFGMGNIIEGTYRHHYLDRRSVANVLEIQYLDRNQNFSQQVVAIEDDAALANGEPVIKVQAEAFGVTRIEQALRIGKYHYKSNREEDEFIEFETIAYLGLTWGDVIQFDHDALPLDGATPLESGRVLAVSGTVVTVDRAVTIRSGNTFLTIQRQADLGIEEGVITNPEGETTHLLELVTSSVAVGDVWILSPNLVDDPFPNLYKIVGIDKMEDQRMKIRAVKHNPEMFNDPNDPPDDIDHIVELPNFN